MAQLGVWDDAKVTIGSLDVSDHVKKVTLNYEAEMLDDTVMGEFARSRFGGLTTWDCEIEMLQDFAAADIDAVLFALIGAAATTLYIRPVNDTISATNPEFTGSAVLQSYGPVSGSVGELAVVNAKFMSAGALTRDVTP